MNRFVIRGPVEPGSEVVLSPEESTHLVRVLRMLPGQRVIVVNGEGAVATAEITETSPKRTLLKVQSVEIQERHLRVAVAFGIPKAEALDFLIRRCVEIGVRELFPLITAHSLRPKTWNEDRWSRVVSEVCKQCEAPYFPRVHQPMELEGWLVSQGSETRLVLCDETERSVSEIIPTEGRLAMLVGPEGGWSEQEREAFQASGVPCLGLGPNRLRMETAALAGLVILKRVIGEM